MDTDISSLSLVEARSLHRKTEKFLSQLQQHIGSLELPDKEVQYKLDAQNYLQTWFIDSFLVDSNKTDGETINIRGWDISVNDVELMNWFIQFADVTNFIVRLGSFVGKREAHISVMNTNWLKSQKLVYCSRFDDSWWRVTSREQWTNVKFQDKLSNYLKPRSKEDIRALFSQCDKSSGNAELMEELTKYLHCQVFSDYWHASELYDEPDDLFVIEGDFDNLDY